MSFYEQQKKMKEQMAHDVIYDAAMKIISESGYEGLTMQKVAQCAGIATGTLYNYFENKKRIFLYIHKRVHDTLLKKLLEVSQQDKDPVVLLEEFFTEIITFCTDNRVVFNLARQLGISDDISLETKLEKIEKSISAIQRIIDNGIMQKKFKPVDSSKTAKMFFFTMVGFLEINFYVSDNSMTNKTHDLLEIFSRYLTE